MVETQRIVEVEQLKDLPKAALELVAFLGDNKFILLFGGMGAGKTTFVKAIGKVLSIQDNISSPSFSIVNEYRTSKNEIIYHFDFYRIKNESEAFDIGFEDYLYSGNLCIIEWPEKVSKLLPENCVTVSITEKMDGTRIFTFEK
ncbi:MAG: tRNA (adenosine(37)-N6)-threonylcarbamoyltransferase complex ATPase subunit type 1 TsaE [Bacteroidetes bacterium]|nr:tRNA (adenosine(37)-N6)-threonylcarbamoyltransferase complex ATPase subunit type 1 TsaE [Bacteroidota bacterium]